MTWLQDMWALDFMRHALISGTAIAFASGLVGYFLVLRSQVFSADALGHVAFTGALAAAAFSVDARLGVVVFVVAVAILLGLLGRRGQADDVVIGGLFAWLLGLGALLLSHLATSPQSAEDNAGSKVLFGSIFGLSATDTWLLVSLGLIAAGALIALARPLLFATLDPALATARGLRVQSLGIAFLVLVGIATAGATQGVGALLVLGLLAAPAGAAMLLVHRPFAAMWLSALLAILAVWVGLCWAFLVPSLPPTFTILAAASGFYVLCAIGAKLRSR